MNEFPEEGGFLSAPQLLMITNFNNATTPCPALDFSTSLRLPASCITADIRRCRKNVVVCSLSKNVLWEAL